MISSSSSSSSITSPSCPRAQTRKTQSHVSQTSSPALSTLRGSPPFVGIASCDGMRGDDCGPTARRACCGPALCGGQGAALALPPFRQGEFRALSGPPRRISQPWPFRKPKWWRKQDGGLRNTHHEAHALRLFLSHPALVNDDEGLEMRGHLQTDILVSQARPSSSQLSVPKKFICSRLFACRENDGCMQRCLTAP